jgi:hypothetical protein
LGVVLPSKSNPEEAEPYQRGFRLDASVFSLHFIEFICDEVRSPRDNARLSVLLGNKFWFFPVHNEYIGICLLCNFEQDCQRFSDQNNEVEAEENLVGSRLASLRSGCWQQNVGIVLQLEHDKPVGVDEEGDPEHSFGPLVNSDEQELNDEHLHELFAERAGRVVPQEVVHLDADHEEDQKLRRD